MDILFYYTGAQTFNGAQPSQRTSLGGLVSSSKVPNAQLSNLFLDVGLLSDVKYEVKCIAMKSTSDTTLQNIDLWFETNSDLFEMEVGSQWLGSNETDVELLTSTYSLPMGIDFHKANVIDGPIQVGNPDANGDIAPGEIVILWLKRIINRNSINSLLSCDGLYAKFKAEEDVYEKEGSIELKISYDK